eukprot:GEMP01003358.1.p1 GENE.GEMP01003358.1~~GEMP01003358.1.p1  ORF type:complete len:1103 (+),score=182.76 GEMP01003358.1:82-3390(+)
MAPVSIMQNELQLEVNPEVQECHPTWLRGQHQSTCLLNWFPSEKDSGYERIAIRALDTRAPLTYRSLRAQCALFKTPLKGRVALVFHRRESAELAVALVVLMNAGCAVCPLDANMSDNEMHHALGHLECAVVVTSRTTVIAINRVRERAGVTVVTVDISATQCGVLEWPKIDNAIVEQKDDWKSTTDVLFLRTSGTTARPKIVGLSLQHLQYNTCAIATSLKLTTADVCLNVMPFFHIGGIVCSLLSVLWARSTVICAPYFDPESFLAAVEGELKPTWYYAVPTIHKAILLHFGATRKHSVTNSRLRLVRSGSAHLPHQDAVDLAHVFGCTVIPTYSMTESMPVCSPMLHYELEKPDSVGYPIGPSLRIGDASGQPLPYGTIGDVLIRGPGVFNGYRKKENHDHNEEDALVDGDWFRTGDRGRMDTDGCVFLTGRSREIVKRGGEQISLHEVDEAVRQHPDVDLCVAFAVPNVFWGEEVAVAVVLKNNNAAKARTSAALIAFARASGLADYKVPAQILILHSAADIPQTATGKYIRSEMQAKWSVSAVDLSAAATLTAASTCHSKDTTSTRAAVVPQVSKAIFGLRFFFAFWVAQYHIGLMPFKAWARVQNFSMNMTGFTFIAGFMLASSVTTRLRTDELRGFYANRISAMHALYLLCLVYALPACIRVSWEKFAEMGIVGHVAGAFLHVVGFGSAGGQFFEGPVVLGVTWYQSALYLNVLLFPLTDYFARECSLRVLQFVMLPSAVFLATIYMPLGVAMRQNKFAWNFSLLAWWPCFTSGVLTHHLWRRCHPGDNSGRVKWAVITDGISLLIFIICSLIASVSCFFPNNDDIFIETPCYDDYPYDEFLDHYKSGRWPSQLGELFGWKRTCTPLIALWVYGLGRGHGYTAALLNQKVFVRYLAPLAYPLYLLHIPTSLYVYWLLHDDGNEDERWWWQMVGLKIVPIPWYSFLLTVFICLLVGAALQKYCTAPLIPYIRQACKPFEVCCCLCCTPESLPDGDASMLAKVVHSIRSLTGTDCDEDTDMENIGVDSFGMVALVGILRSQIPHAKNLAPARLYDFKTVGQLVAALEALEPPLESSTRQRNVTPSKIQHQNGALDIA